MREEIIAGATPWVRIYALCDRAGEVRYVGKTSQWLHARHKAHIRAAQRGGTLPIHWWLRKQIAAGEPLAIHLIENVKDGVDWRDREMYWISFYRAKSSSLLNLTNGGEGLHGHKFAGTAHARKIADAIRTGATFHCEVCESPFWRRRNEINKGHNKYCSRRCSNGRNKGRSLFHAN